MKNSATTDDIFAALSDFLDPNQILFEQSDCWVYGYDNSRQHVCPDFVAFPKDHNQVTQIVRLCYTNNIPITARGKGTGTTGATVPVKQGLVLSFEKFNKIKLVDPNNRIIITEPGATNQTIQNRAGEHGFFWPPDPTSAAFCSVGGNLAYNSAGPKAVKYGTPRENTLGLKAVTGTGETIITGVHTTKGVVGYDLTRLIIGSEGSLAIITEAILKLTPLPEEKITMQATYRSIDDASKAVSSIMAQPITPCALEFIDSNAIAMIKDYSSIPLPDNAGAILMIEVDGPASSMSSAVQAIESSATNSGLIKFHRATNQQDIDSLWSTRKALSPALRNVAPKKINEDVVVPVSKIPDLINRLDYLGKKYAIKIVNFGHAGNGNIHVNLLINPDDPIEAANAQHCLSDIFDYVLKVNGSISGEHGIGLEKRGFIAREINKTTLNLMTGIKKQFDPKGILNPGKIFPEN